MKTHTKTLLATLTLCTAALAGTAHAATITATDALNVAGLSEGDSFQIAFVTSTITSRDALDGSADGADNTDLADWNAYVNSVASGSTFTGVSGLSWSAMVSVNDGVTSTDARDNAVVSGVVYMLDGDKIADNATDMWDGSIDTNLDLNENNLANGGAANGVRVWTGSTDDGTIDADFFLGAGNSSDSALVGKHDRNDGVWFNNGSSSRRPVGTELHVYALSEVITVVPEPGSLALLGLGGLLIARRRRG